MFYQLISSKIATDIIRIIIVIIVIMHKLKKASLFFAIVRNVYITCLRKIISIIVNMEEYKW